MSIRRNLKHLSLLSGIFSCLIVFVLSCQSSAPPISTLSIAHNVWVGYAPCYVAEKKGFFDEQGLKVTRKIFPDDGVSISAFSAGRTDGMMGTVNSFLIGIDKEQDFKVVGLIDYSSGADGVIGRNLSSLADAKGKKIGVPLGTPNHALLMYGLEEYGLTGKDVQLLNLTADQAQAAYITKSLDIASIFEPFMSSAVSKGGGKVIYSSADAPGLISDAIAFSGGVIKNRPGDVTKFLKGMMKGAQYIKDQPKESLQIIAEELNITPQEAADQLKGVEILGLEENKSALSNAEDPKYFSRPYVQARDFAFSQGFIKSKPEIEEAFDFTFVKSL